MTNNVTGIVLDIPPTVLQNIKNADKAIKDLEQSSLKAARNIKFDFDTTMVNGVDAFIRKVQEAQTKLGGLKMPTIDASGLSSAIQALSQAMATIDKSATTGSNRLTRIANAMTALQTANPDPQLFQNIADGIAKIGNTSQQTIQNVTQLAAVMAQLAKDIRTVQTAQNAQNANTATAAQYNKLFKEQADLVRRINEIKAKGADADGRDLTLLDRMRARYDEINQQLEKLNRKKQTAASELAQMQGTKRVGDAQARSDAAGAINYAKQAKSLQDLQAAYKNLKAVMATTNPNTKEWRQMNLVLEQTRDRINKIKKKMGEFKSTAQGVGDIAGQMKRTLAAVFSVSAITGYINKLIEVRAQFELQQTALRAILQDKQKADEVFQQVQQMALQSPFSIMQMTTFTKQLAAYRIEADKLVGTTKMLADVSAGLGVDMSRLILAYGQVKAANYLRACLGKGTRVKMFDGTFKNVEDVIVGDVLMGDDEQPRHVSKLYQGEQQMYRVSYLGGSFRCNEHHVLTVYDALKMRVSDVFVLDYLREPYRYHGVKRIDGEYKTFIMKVEPDNIDTYYGFSIDGNHRFIIENNVVTHNTEVRQFTEAGLNIAGELATYFSELQGKMISVGDVMEMITKRMVRFEDVEEVFKRVTSAGGLFYDMQRKQSETLWGQMQRIKDAMSIMFNEIGKSNQGTIAWFLTAIRTMINNWRTLAAVINDIGIGLAVLFAAKQISRFIEYWPKLVTNVKSFISFIKLATSSTAAFKGALASIGVTGWGAIIAAVGALVMLIHDAVSATDELKEELDRIANESAKDMWDLVYAFRENASIVRDGTKAYDERKKALEELHNTFKDILPVQMLEYEGIMRLSEGYREATDAIMVYSAEKARQAAAAATQTKKQEKYEKVIDNAKRFATNIISLYDLPTDSAHIASVRGVIGNIMRQIQREVEEGSITTAQQGYDRFIETLQSHFGQMPNNLEAEGFKSQLSDVFFPTRFREDFDDYLNYGIEQQREFEAEYSQLLGSEMRQDDIALQAVKSRYNQRKRALEQLQTAYLNYYNLVRDGVTQGDEFDDARMELQQAVDAVNTFQTGAGQAQVSMDSLVAATTSQTDVMLQFGEVQDKVLGSFIRNIRETSRTAPEIVKWVEQTEEELRRAGLSQTQLDIIKIAKDWAEANGVAAASVDRLRISADTNYTSAAQDAKKLSDQAAENIQKIEQSRLKLIALGRTADEALSEAQGYFGGKSIDELEKEKEYWDNVAKTLGYYEKTRDTGRTRDVWTPRLQLIEKVNREYEKLLKYYSKEEAMTRIRQSYGDAVAETFKNTQWADIAQWGDFDDTATIQRMQAVGEAAGGAYKRKFLEAAGTIQSEIDIKIEEKNIQTAKDQIQELFDNYELTKTLGNLGLNVDLTYLVGGQPVKLEDVRRKLETELADVRATGGEEDIVKAYEEALRKVTEMENKNAIERLKNYNKYLLESMSERVRIELKAQQEISKIRNDETLDEFSKEQAINNRRKQMQEELTKYDFDQFKGSDVYLQTFKDLERASKSQLQYVIDKLKEMQAVNKDLSPLQVKSIAQEIKKAEDALAKQDSLKNFVPNMRVAIQYLEQRNNLLSEQVRLQDELTATQEKQSEAQKLLTELTQNRDAIADKNSQAWITANALVEEQRRLVKEIEEKAKALGVDLKGVTDTIGKGEASLNNIKGLWNNIAQTLNAISSTIGDISEGLDAMGLLSDGLADAFSSAQAVIGNFVQVGGGAVQAFTDPSPWGKLQGALSVVGGAMKLVGSIFAIGDKKKERQIKRLQEKVEDLQRAYKKLHTAIEEAYAFDDYNAGYNQSMRNLQEQQKAIQEQLALERAKKKSDEGKIQGYIDALDELKEKEKELRESRYEAMGSMGDKGIMSEAENWVKTWLDAYKETGDGLDALSDQWDEFFENLVLKQAASAVVSKRMKKYVDQINAAIDSGDTGLSLSQTFAQIGQNLKNELGIWNEDLKAFFDAVGIKGGQGELLLSDLQKGIQNITEPQAAAIEAYLNSMRFAVFEQNNILTNMLTAIQAQYSTNGDSPVLQEVRAIRTLVASIDDRLSRVIVSRNSASSGYSVKVS